MTQRNDLKSQDSNENKPLLQKQINIDPHGIEAKDEFIKSKLLAPNHLAVFLYDNELTNANKQSKSSLQIIDVTNGRTVAQIPCKLKPFGTCNLNKLVELPDNNFLCEYNVFNKTKFQIESVTIVWDSHTNTSTLIANDVFSKAIGFNQHQFALLTKNRKDFIFHEYHQDAQNSFVKKLGSINAGVDCFNNIVPISQNEWLISFDNGDLAVCKYQDNDFVLGERIPKFFQEEVVKEYVPHIIPIPGTTECLISQFKPAKDDDSNNEIIMHRYDFNKRELISSVPVSLCDTFKLHSDKRSLLCKSDSELVIIDLESKKMIQTTSVNKTSQTWGLLDNGQMYTIDNQNNKVNLNILFPEYIARLIAQPKVLKGVQQGINEIFTAIRDKKEQAQDFPRGVAEIIADQVGADLQLPESKDEEKHKLSGRQ